eukprot:COSAG01_NODE_38797_length_485_cov_0.626943_1_plen_28_part_10
MHTSYRELSWETINVFLREFDRFSSMQK